MKNNLNYLKNNLNLCGCIYISCIDNHIEVKIDKVFDTAVYPEYIERLMVTKKIFDNISDSLKYIQRSIFV